MINEFRDEYAFLSNFYSSPFYINKLKYITNEHFYQSMKTTDIVEMEKIRLCKTPGISKRLGAKVKLRTDWEKVKLLVMYKGVYAKFNQNNNLKNKLLATYPRKLVEGNNWNDYYWGFCRGRGENKLGKIITRIRNQWIQQLSGNSIF